MASDQTDRRNGLTSGLAIKTPVKAATTASLGAGASGLQIIDGYQTVAGDRILRKNEVDQKLNGIWNAAAGVWTRAKDCDGNLDLMQGTLVRVVNGTISGPFYELTTTGPIVIGSSNLVFAAVSPSSLFQILDSIAALKLVGIPLVNTLYVVRGFAAVGDGGGGFYYWSAADVTADNGGTIIQLTAGGNGRFNKLF